MKRTARRFLALGMAALALAGCTAGSGESRPPGADEGGRTVTAPVQRVFLDVSYATLSPRQALDIYLPPSGDGPFPVLVYVHGGSYVEGDKRDLVAGMVELANDRGMALVSINYRLLSDAPFPAQVHDVKAAVRWLRAHADEYALDPDAVALWGISAGGHLAALTGTSDGVPELDDPSLGNPEQPSTVAAVVDWYGPSDFFALEPYLAVQERADGTVESRLDHMQELLAADPALMRAADPSSHADPGDPPIRIEHGDRDTIVPLDQSTLLASRLREKMGDDRVTLVVEDGQGHGTAVFVSAEKIGEVLDWVEAAIP